MSQNHQTILKNRLAELGVSSDAAESTDLFFVRDKESAPPAVRIALEQAEHYKADAVFFRTFPKPQHRSPLPQIYIYERIRLDFSPEEFGEIHRHLWNAELVPLAAVLTANAVRLINCRKEPQYDEEYSSFRCEPFERLQLILHAERVSLAQRVAAGTLWEDSRFADDFSFEHTAHATLLNHLRYYKAELLNSDQLSEPVAKRILVLAILLKYLDDRRDEQNNSVFPDGFFDTFTNASDSTLSAVFKEKGVCVALFDRLSRHFNGRIFELSAEERNELSTADLTLIAHFLEGVREPGGQQNFWRLYSFDDLPVELISNIYEEFLANDGQSKKGIVYTPPMLVELLLDQCVPLDPESLDMKILDPACGSGVFLVGAFRRLVHCWRMANEWQWPNHEDLKGILRQNMYGVDIKEEAVLVTAFSLCVALCDELEPKAIWEELQFDDLRQDNLQACDAFDIVQNQHFNGQFDLIIGNPPFDSELTTEAAKNAEKSATEERPKVPDKQLALLFLEQSFHLCKADGSVCLIQPAGPLLYNVKAGNFRNYLFDKYDIQCVFDFTPLESVLFKANVAAAAILAQNRKPGEDELLHLVFRRTRSSACRLLFEVDYYDFHWLARDYVKNNPYAWKVDLLGGGRLHWLVERFSNLAKLEDFLAAKKQNSDWAYSEGFTIGSGSQLNTPETLAHVSLLSDDEVNRLYKPKQPVSRGHHLTGKTCVSPSALSCNHIKSNRCAVLNAVFFQRPISDNKKIFKPPHVLIREIIRNGHIPAVFSNEYLVFSKQIYGVHAPPGEEGELRDMAWRLSCSNLYAALLAAMSSRYLVGRATSLLANDLKNLPYPDRSELELAWWEETVVEDVVSILADFRRRGENADAVQSPQQDDIEVFGQTYAQALNSVYEHFRPLQPMHVGDFICFPFCYGSEPDIKLPTEDNADAVLQEICQKQQGPRLFINRIIRLYEQNVIFMVKPNQKRFWLRSVALRDADETIAELIEAGY